MYLSLVLRLQSYIVTCEHLCNFRDSLLDYNLTTCKGIQYAGVWPVNQVRYNDSYW
jgi:hypothetical protein